MVGWDECFSSHLFLEHASGKIFNDDVTHQYLSRLFPSLALTKDQSLTPIYVPFHSGQPVQSYKPSVTAERRNSATDDVPSPPSSSNKTSPIGVPTALTPGGKATATAKNRRSGHNSRQGSKKKRKKEPDDGRLVVAAVGAKEQIYLQCRLCFLTFCMSEPVFVCKGEHI
jgi:hypothetical protein